MAPEFQVIKWVCERNGRFGARWRVFTTPVGYLFVLVQNPAVQRPVHRDELTYQARSDLANGRGHA